MKILIIYPHGNALNPISGAETRIWNLNRSLLNKFFDISILHSIKSKGLEDLDLKSKINVHYYRDFSVLGVSDWYFSDFNPFYVLKLYKLLRKNNFKIIQIEFPWGFFILKVLAKKNSILIYDSQGVESEFMKVAIKNPKFPKFLKQFAYIYAKIYEKLVCKLADVVITVSDVDRGYYLEKYKIPKSKTFLIQTPSQISSKNIEISRKMKKEYRRKLNLPLDKTIVVFHGGLPHPPNQEAFDLIENFIAPNFENKEILFVIAGFNLKQYSKNNIISLGFVEDLTLFLYSADLAIVPIISGSGMRVKCADYINVGLPFISTKKGIEGLKFLKHREDCLIYDKVNNKFIEGINILYKNKDLRNKFHKNLLKKSNKLNQNIFENRFIKLYLKLKSESNRS